MHSVNNISQIWKNVRIPQCFVYGLGAITIFWVEIEEETGLPEIVKLQPFAQKDLAIRALGDCIKDLDQCVTLYPNIAKDIAFGKYYSHVDGKTLRIFRNSKFNHI